MGEYAIRSFICVGCGESVEKRCTNKTSFCSLECYRKTKTRPKRKTGVYTKCSQCDTKIYVQKSQVRNHNFCSTGCHNKFQGRNKLKYSCKVCSNEFAWSPSRIKDNNPTYCSIECRNKCPEWKTNAVIAGNLKLQQSKNPTRLEIAGYKILDDAGIEYVKQVLIAEKFIVDTLIPDKKLVIQWDGDYWHGYRADGDTIPLDKRQSKRAALDKSQDAYMAKCGYVVLRFWEHEVFNQPEKVCEVIKNTIRQSAA